jgi:2-keto-4-pentenoate hydratase
MRTEPLARALILAHRHARLLPATPADGPGDNAEAYAVQQAVWQGWAGERRPTAWKVGAAAPDLEPTAAPVFPDRLLTSPAVFNAFPAGLGVEAEIALRFAHDLPARAQAYAREEILAAIGSAHVAMELVASRLADPEAAGPHWRLADNLLNAALVVGDEVPDWRNLDWQHPSAEIRLDGQRLTGGPSRPPLDDIFHCLAWWLEHAGGARAGDIVTTGAWSGMHPLAGPGRVVAEFAGLGRAEVLISRA